MKLIILLSLFICLLLFGFAISATTNSGEKMNIKILYDSSAINNKYKTGWGFSCLINNHILFDTGADGNSLVNNLSLMKINSINKIIISHEHYDHTGGLWQILKQQKNLPIYICPNFSQAFKNQIKKSGSDPIEVTPL